MNDPGYEITPEGLPVWAARALGKSLSADQQFESVLDAYARHHSRPAPPTKEQMAAFKKAQKRNNPLHVKAVARRRKRKRGGPK